MAEVLVRDDGHQWQYNDRVFAWLYYIAVLVMLVLGVVYSVTAQVFASYVTIIHPFIHGWDTAPARPRQVHGLLCVQQLPRLPVRHNRRICTSGCAVDRGADAVRAAGDAHGAAASPCGVVRARVRHV